jgi:hypothetical protein
MTRVAKVLLAIIIPSGFSFSVSAFAQSSTPPSQNDALTPDNAVMLTIFLKPDETRPLAELNAQLERSGFYKAFPPAGVEVVSWNIVMGIGQVVTLRLPAPRLREVNRIFRDYSVGRLPHRILSDL